MTNNIIETIPHGEWDLIISSILKKFSYKIANIASLTYDDLRQEAWIGLLKAAEKYDPTMKTKFTTYAYNSIIWHVKRLINPALNSREIETDEDMVHPTYEDDTVFWKDFIECSYDLIRDEPNADLIDEYFFKDKSYREIAKERSTNHVTIANSINRLIDLLCKRLQNENS